MRPLCLVAAVACALGLGACAAVPPSAEETAQLPVVRFGEPAPTGKRFITHYPKSVPLPVIAMIDGTLLDRTAKAMLEVTVKRDVYLYGPWISFDGKSWLNGEGAVTTDIRLLLPGHDGGKAPGELSARFDLK